MEMYQFLSLTADCFLHISEFPELFFSDLPKGHVKDVFVYHKVYGVLRANMDIKSRRDVRNYLEEIRTGKSSLLKNVTSGYHYHTICAESEEVLDAIQEELKQKGFLAKLQDYEPVDFWGDNEDEAKA